MSVRQRAEKRKRVGKTDPSDVSFSRTEWKRSRRQFRPKPCSFSLYVLPNLRSPTLETSILVVYIFFFFHRMAGPNSKWPFVPYKIFGVKATRNVIFYYRCEPGFRSRDPTTSLWNRARVARHIKHNIFMWRNINQIYASTLFLP